MAQNLFEELQQKKERLATLAKKAREFGWIDEAREKEIQEKLNNDVLTIGVIGQMKCGKSTFLNAFEFEDETGKSFSYQAECYWGGLEWTVETDKTKRSFWFPRLISEVYCDYYNPSFRLTGILIAGCILFAASILSATIDRRRANRLLKQHTKNRQKQ